MYRSIIFDTLIGGLFIVLSHTLDSFLHFPVNARFIKQCESNCGRTCNAFHCVSICEISISHSLPVLTYFHSHLQLHSAHAFSFPIQTNRSMY